MGTDIGRPGGYTLMIFAFEIRRESNPRGSKPHLIRSATLTIRPTEYIRYLKCKNHHKFSPLGDVSCESVNTWEHLFLWCNRIVAPPIAPYRSRVLETGSFSCRSLTRGRSDSAVQIIMPGFNSWTTWTGKCSHANSPLG